MLETDRRSGRYQQQTATKRVKHMDTPAFITFMVMWMLLFFGVLIIVLSYRHNRHLIDLNHKERMNALERGLELPPLATRSGELQQRERSAYYLHRGLIFALLGFSMMA